MPDDWDAFRWDRFSVVRLGRPGKRLFAHTVMSDQMADALMAFDTIRKKGYERIGFVGGAWRPRHFGAGYLWALASAPMDKPKNRIRVLKIG